MSPSRRIVRGAVLVAVFGALALIPVVGSALTSGGCTVQGQASRSGVFDASSQSVWHVQGSDVLRIVATAPSTQAGVRIDGKIFGLAVPMLSYVTNGTQTSVGPFQVSDFSNIQRTWGFAASSPTCAAEMTVVVDDASIIGNFAGMVGLLLTLAGLGGLAALMFGRPGALGGILGAACGLGLGTGLGLILQEAAVLDPRSLSDLVFPAAGLGLGLAANMASFVRGTDSKTQRERAGRRTLG